MFPTLNYPLVIILCALLAGASFLGVDHVLSGAFVGGMYTAVISAVTVGHFSNKSNGIG